MSFTVGGGVQVETLVLFVFLSRGTAALGSEGSNANAVRGSDGEIESDWTAIWS